MTTSSKKDEKLNALKTKQDELQILLAGQCDIIADREDKLQSLSKTINIQKMEISTATASLNEHLETIAKKENDIADLAATTKADLSQTHGQLRERLNEIYNLQQIVDQQQTKINKVPYIFLLMTIDIYTIAKNT